MDEALMCVLRDAEAADRKYGGMTSTAEGLGVLVEEFDELRQAIRENSLESVFDEAVQVSAVALRIARSCRHDAAFCERSGFKRR